MSRRPKPAAKAAKVSQLEDALWAALARAMAAGDRKAVFGEDWSAPASPLSKALASYHAARAYGDWLGQVEQAWRPEDFERAAAAIASIG